MAQTQTTPEAPTTAPKRGFRFPTAFTVLVVVLVVVWGLAFVVTPGSYTYVSCDGSAPRPVPGSYQAADSSQADQSLADRIYQLALAPVNGLYGIRVEPEPVTDPGAEVLAAGTQECGGGSVEILTAPGITGPYETGGLAGAVQVFFFVLAIGSFITVTLRTGALDAGIARITHRFRTRGLLLVAVLMVVFSLGGTTYGMAEETLGFYALLVPIVIGLGFDRMVGVGMILVGAGVGTLASTVNPFATGVGSSGAGIPLGEGIALRVVMYLVLTPVALLYVLRYARTVRLDPSRSVLGADAVSSAGGDAGPGTSTDPEPLPPRHKAVLAVFAATFALMIVSVIPWSDFFPSLADPLAAVFMPWYFPELAALFLIGSVVVGLLGGLGEEKTVGAVVAGMGDFMGAALIIAIARGVTVIMNNASITDTVLNSLEGLVAGLSSAVFAVAVYLVNIPLALLVPSSSGHATLAMPIMAPLADFAQVSRALVVTAYQSASGWVNLFTPTSAVVMGGLALAKVPYDKYLRFVWPLLLALFVLTAILIALGALVPALGG
jgi:uncharacterized ion transporter superfamily protein YfcC